MTHGVTSRSDHVADWSALVGMTTVTLMSRVRQIRSELQQLRAVQLDCSSSVQQDITDALKKIKVVSHHIAVM